ncbi:MAG: Alanine--tRNA ligase [Alphaproteobacteria bacterium MarineAlpha5_Bin9]|nr:MAG: Alanine--tRNA ligase [Alphaproteobacteria bacterium MarineAlpha5_Bin9]|tara:strand:+ start:26991 stop:29663 length:2673 start_codon:yes stop_codon:yes gene_type:complete
MKSTIIRNKFIDYFKKNNHEVIHSGPLVPHNDPSLMFANSGMVQFKNVFTGKEKRDFKRAVTSQKCVRAGGKHNDLENVGYTTRHHTFFEMLGNFSFGDYFKDLAIELAWKLITQEFDINKNKLLVTIFNEDEQAYKLWKKISGLSDNQIIKISTSDNFWSMGETGPCGPCSEIFFDHGDKYIGGPPGSKNEDGDRYIEIWNLVFMQYDQVNIDKRINLPKPSIDTGMGLERISALLNGSNDNYSTDLFSSLIRKSVELSNNESLSSSPSHRVIADHLRSASFLIADGVMPSNEGRGYVLRRIMRRGMRHAHTLGNKEPVFHKIFPILLENMKDSFPELILANELIHNTFFNEETKFKETVEKGIKLLEQEINKSSKSLDGDVAFKLYDTYGFPIDLIEDYLKDKNIKVNMKSFNSKMNEQRSRARKSWKGIGNIEYHNIWYDITETLQPTEFLGYDKNITQSQIKAIIFNQKNVKNLKINDEGIIFLNQTPFYSESGGQVGDTGVLINENFEFKVENTTRIFANYFLHHGKVLKGECKLEDSVEAKINIQRREFIKYNHSSTHLLHSALRKILGNHVSQKGSLVNDQKLRFDFNHNLPINEDIIKNIENLVNQQISDDLEIKTKILDQKKAIEDGAIALFGEKYEDEVRVITIQNNEDVFFSKELCGGTHVKKLSEIKNFKIINQSNIASGVKRIEAVTNIHVNNYIKNIKKLNQEIEKSNLKNIHDYRLKINKIDPTIKINIDHDLDTNLQLKELKKIYDKLKQKINLNKNNDKIIIEKINNITFIYLIAENYPINSLKKFIDDQKSKYPNKCIACIISKNDSKISIVLGSTIDLNNKFDSSLMIKDISVILEGKGGGGRKDLAQAGGKNFFKINDAISKLKDKIYTL